MNAIQQVRCPNCGSLAERHFLPEGGVVRTQCGSCDYLLVMCSQTNRVIECYAPGLPGEQIISSHSSHCHSLAVPKISLKPITAVAVTLK